MSVSILVGADATITGNLVNANLLRPGSGVSRLTVQGNFQQTITGNLQIEIGGTGAGVSYDQLRITSTATLDGTLALQAINGFNPALNSTYSVVTYGSHLGEFAVINGTTPVSGKVWQPDYQNLGLSIVTTQPLYLEPVTAVSTPKAGVITDATLTTLADEAKQRWVKAGYSGSALNSVNVRISDLQNGFLGLAGNNTIWIDFDASGVGWFIDTTASNDEEFLLKNGTLSALNETAASGRIDLLSVLMHEMGHLIGLDDHHDSTDSSVLNESLSVGTRILPSPLDLDELFSDNNILDQL